MIFIRPETVRDPKARQEVDPGKDKCYLVMGDGATYTIGESKDGHLMIRSDDGNLIVHPRYANQVYITVEEG